MQTVRMTRRARQEQTRSNILDAGLGVFRRDGYARATIEDVAELAGCTRGTVYLHFGSKHGLFLAVVELHLDDQVAAFQARLDDAADDDLLGLLVGVVAPATQRATLLLDWAVMLGDLHEDDPDLVRRARAVQAAVDDAIARLVERLCRARRVQPTVSSTRLAALLLALGNGLTARAALDPEVDLATELGVAVDLMLREASR